MITPTILTILMMYLGKYNPIFYLLAIIFFGDVVGRTMDYIKLRKLIKSGNYSLTSIVKIFRHSHCQRQTTLLAFRGQERRTISEAYKGLGYRWYHLLPDWTYNNKKILLTKKFWLSYVGIE